MSEKIQRRDVDRAYINLSSRQREDLKLFARLKKWTASLLALQHQMDQSSANRRLRKLAALGAVAVRRGQPQPDGGRTPDLYYLTALGARLVTRMLDLGSSYVEAPDVTNEADNAHDLATLEVAIRAQALGHAAIFERRVFKLQGGEDLTLIPDIALYDNHYHCEVYVEVEQTAKVEHYARKFTAYGKIMADYEARGQAAPILLMVYPTAVIEEALLDEHMAAASQALSVYRTFTPAIKSVSVEVLRYQRVDRLHRVYTDANAQGERFVLHEGVMQLAATWFEM